MTIESQSRGHTDIGYCLESRVSWAMWIFWCLLKLLLSENTFPQILHFNFLRSMCIFRCRFKLPRWVNSLPQILHTKILRLMWIFRCLLNRKLLETLELREVGLGVTIYMLIQVATVRKFLSTNIAFDLFEASVGAFMPIQVGTVSKFQSINFAFHFLWIFRCVVNPPLRE